MTASQASRSSTFERVGAAADKGRRRAKVKRSDGLHVRARLTSAQRRVRVKMGPRQGGNSNERRLERRDPAPGRRVNQRRVDAGMAARSADRLQTSASRRSTSRRRHSRRRHVCAFSPPSTRRRFRCISPPGPAMTSGQRVRPRRLGSSLSC